MNMVTVKTLYLIGDPLDWLVGQCEEEEVKVIKGRLETRWTQHGWKPSSYWAQGGLIIEREQMDINCHMYEKDKNLHWRATIFKGEEVLKAFGPAPLIAAMRCYVLYRLGQEAKVPEILLAWEA